MKTGSCERCGYLSLCDEHRKQALAENFDVIKNMSRPANTPTPTVSETSLFKQLAESLVRRGIALNDGGANVTEPALMEAFRTVEREALERAARACIEADETGCDTGQFYAKVVLSVSGDTET